VLFFLIEDIEQDVSEGASVVVWSNVDSSLEKVEPELYPCVVRQELEVVLAPSFEFLPE
jgi:hypothetical protein